MVTNISYVKIFFTGLQSQCSFFCVFRLDLRDLDNFGMSKTQNLCGLSQNIKMNIFENYIMDERTLMKEVSNVLSSTVVVSVKAQSWSIKS